ncbi:MAG: 50S ribosomal protein L6 [Firmicutes bacterium]|jgi:large subunit ribosomal protein L6|nr:50S ribosomal protein L6 [Bacillota bacterium]
MSRIGKLPVEIPAGVEVKIDENNLVTVKGPKGTLEKQLSPRMKISQKDGHVVVERSSDLKQEKSLHGLTRALLHNMVVGVTQGFEKKLEINGVGYRAAKQGNKLILSLGYSHPVEMEDPEGVEAVVEDPTKITIKGIDREKVGQYAANIRFKRPPEPYKGKGIKYADEHILRKVGKTGK